VQTNGIANVLGAFVAPFLIQALLLIGLRTLEIYWQAVPHWLLMYGDLVPLAVSIGSGLFFLVRLFPRRKLLAAALYLPAITICLFWFSYKLVGYVFDLSL
jgi:hypothetical protein